MSIIFWLHGKEEISQRRLDPAIMNRWLYQRWCFILLCSNEDIRRRRVFYEFSSLVTVGERDFRFPSGRHWSILPLARKQKTLQYPGRILVSLRYVRFFARHAILPEGTRDEALRKSAREATFWSADGRLTFQSFFLQRMKQRINSEV